MKSYYKEYETVCLLLLSVLVTRFICSLSSQVTPDENTGVLLVEDLPTGVTEIRLVFPETTENVTLTDLTVKVCSEGMNITKTLHYRIITYLTVSVDESGSACRLFHTHPVIRSLTAILRSLYLSIVLHFCGYGWLGLLLY